MKLINKKDMYNKQFKQGQRWFTSKGHTVIINWCEDEAKGIWRVTQLGGGLMGYRVNLAGFQLNKDGSISKRGDSLRGPILDLLGMENPRGEYETILGERVIVTARKKNSELFWVRKPGAPRESSWTVDRFGRGQYKSQSLKDHHIYGANLKDHQLEDPVYVELYSPVPLGGFSKESKETEIRKAFLKGNGQPFRFCELVSEV